eukprot:TRINITY_DN11637_c2_g1_i1.p1 TRINITY_DN11637_c2_g1~~TRINITY_DN11637_c2_g1_i1.p1  ORF type:complete len:822 (+),score=104.25 TRINITY_DN11637_c2_g1_i1:167-2632(+)
MEEPTLADLKHEMQDLKKMMRGMKLQLEDQQNTRQSRRSTLRGKFMPFGAIEEKPEKLSQSDSTMYVPSAVELQEKRTSLTSWRTTASVLKAVSKLKSNNRVSLEPKAHVQQQPAVFPTTQPVNNIEKTTHGAGVGKKSVVQLPPTKLTKKKIRASVQTTLVPRNNPLKSNKERGWSKSLCGREEDVMIPNGTAKIVIDIFVLVALLIEFVCVLWIWAASLEDFEIWYIFVALWSSMVNFIWILTNFRTAFIQGFTLTDNPAHIQLHYLRGWFAFDLILSIPWDIIASTFASTLAVKICAGIRVFRLCRERGLMQKLNPVEDPPNWQQAIRVTFWFSISLHIATCSWVYIATHTDQGFESKEALEQNRVAQYVAALYWTCATISSTGYGDISATSTGSRILANLWIWGGVGITVWIGAKVTQWMVVVDPYALAELKKRRQLYSLMTKNRIPWKVQKSAFAIYPVVLETSSHDYNTIIDELPRFLQDQIRLHVKIKLIDSVPIFRGISEECQAALAQVMLQEFFPVDENVIEYGDQGMEMFFVEHGIVEIYTINPDGEEVWMANLKGGSFFGEIALMSEDCRRTATVRAVTSCTIYTLTKQNFTLIASVYPDLKAKMEEEAIKRLADIKKNLQMLERIRMLAKMHQLRPNSDDSKAKERWKRVVLEVLVNKKKAIGTTDTSDENTNNNNNNKPEEDLKPGVIIDSSSSDDAGSTYTDSSCCNNKLGIFPMREVTMKSPVLQPRIGTFSEPLSFLPVGRSNSFCSNLSDDNLGRKNPTIICGHNPLLAPGAAGDYQSHASSEVSDDDCKARREAPMSDDFSAC